MFRYCFCLLLVTAAAGAAEQNALPAPMSSAIDRLMNPERQKPTDKADFLAKTPEVRILQLPPGPVRLGLEPCSIPLAEASVSDQPKFFIQALPAPKESPDGMPVLRAPVCPVATAREAEAAKRR